MKKSLFILFAAVMLTGCKAIRERVIYEPAPVPTPAAVSPAAQPASQPNAEIIERRFVTAEGQPDAVQSAITWAKKYEELSEQNTVLREKHNQLFLQNTQLTSQLDQTKAELERTRKELAEANEFLQQMHTELNKWKSDVLGFRDEMRQAQKAQLEALSRILQVLGAESVKPAVQQ